MRCEDAMKKILEEDAGIGLRARAHVLFCPRCRKEAYVLEDAMLLLRQSSPFEMRRDLSDLIMGDILRCGVHPEYNVSNIKWLASGAILMFSIGLITFSDTFSWLKWQFGRELEIPVSLVMGVVLSLYSALFIGSHMRYLKEQIAIYSKKLPNRKV